MHEKGGHSDLNGFDIIFYTSKKFISGALFRNYY